MPLITILLRPGLAAIFATAGLTKFSDPPGTQAAVKNFGVPESFAPLISVLLPIFELSIAAGLLFSATTRPSALAALVLLLIFVVAIGVNLARGKTHDCHCFGQLYSRPLGWPTLARNLVFAAAAALVFWQSTIVEPGSIALTIAALTTNQLLWLLGGVLFTAAVVVYYSRKHNTATTHTAPRPQGLPVNSAAPAFEITAYQGGTMSLAQLIAFGKPVLLIFTNPTCGPCVTLFAEIKNWQQAHSEQLTIALLSFGTIKENFVNVARNQLGQVLLQKQKEVAELYGANLTPAAVIVNSEGRIASKLAAGADEIRELLQGTLGIEPNSNHRHQHQH
jgi:protein-disulfide isomerase